MKQNEDSLRDLWDIKCKNICTIVVPEGEEREKGPKNLFEEIIVENFFILEKKTVTQVQEVQIILYSTNPPPHQKPKDTLLKKRHIN